jgi:outer membrane immunogenic protein
MNLKITIAGLAVAASSMMALPGGVLAADIVEPVPYIAPAPAYSNWGGFYVGGHAGYGWGSRDGCIDYVDLFADCDLANDIIGAFPFDYEQKGWLIGGQAGYNYMLGPHLLIGAEVDASLANIEGSTGALIGAGTGTYNWTAAAKLRAGLANDWGLVYLTGGLGLAGFEWSESLGCSFEQIRSGWLVGAGAEFKLSPRTSVKAEYNYIDFGSESDACTSLAFIPGYVETSARLHLLKVGLNFMLGPDGMSAAAEAFPPEAADQYAGWNGFYAGIHSGYGWGNRDGCIDYVDLFGDCNLVTDIIGAFPFDYEQKGWLAGGQLGYNHVLGSHFLIGAEVDASLADIQGNPGGLIGEGKGEYSWLASAKLRAGLAHDWGLVYVTGGLAAAGFDWQEALGCDFEQTRTGWLVGGGAEVKITKRASVKAEYNYVDYGNQTDTCTSLAIVPGFVSTNARQHLLKVGLNYNFGS